MIIKIYIQSLLLYFFLGYPFNLIEAQDFTWWNTRHNWDGVTHWSRYMILSPAFMGPNALPVPQIKNGVLPNQAFISIGGERHFSPGDKTTNIVTELYIPLFTSRVGLYFQIVPYEHYRLDTQTRDLRIVRDFDGKGNAFGDLYIGTHIQILEERKALPGIALSITLKTASGNKLSAARFTDTPGYYFDLSVGKTYPLNHKTIHSIRPYIMTGLYVWHTYQVDHYQNDSFLYGLGVDLGFSKILLRNVLGGYLGYIGNGDRPLVYRLIVESNLKKNFDFKFRFQQGLSDFDYTSIRLSLLHNLNSIK